MGKRKIPIAKIANKSSLMVSFSKRRQGLFKKASDLCSLTGAHIAILVFSPAGRTFSFGHPSFDSVIDRYVRQCNGSNVNFSSPASSSALGSSHSVDHLDNLNQRLFDVQRQLNRKVEKNRRLKGGNPSRGWWDLDVEGFDVGQLEMYLSELEKFREVVASRVVEASSRDKGLEKKEVGYWNMISPEMEASKGLEKKEVGFWDMISREMEASEGLEKEEVDMKASSSEEEVGFWGKQCLIEEVGFWGNLEEEAGFFAAENCIRIGDEKFLV